MSIANTKKAEDKKVRWGMVLCLTILEKIMLKINVKIF